MPGAIIHGGICLFVIIVFFLGTVRTECDEGDKEMLNLALILNIFLGLSFIGWGLAAARQDMIDDGIYYAEYYYDLKEGSRHQVVIDSKGRLYNITETFKKVYNPGTKFVVRYYDPRKLGIYWHNEDKSKIYVYRE